MSLPWQSIQLVAFDIDGTLTDASTSWAGGAVGWTQRYSTRDGEALLAMKRAGLQVVPISRNKTRSARERMEALGFDTDWLGVSDKTAALREVLARFRIDVSHVLYVGDGPDDAPLFSMCRIGVAVADAHPSAIAAADLVCEARGGERVMEELAVRLLEAGDDLPGSAAGDAADLPRGSDRRVVASGPGSMVAVGIMSGTSADGVDAVSLRLNPSLRGSAELLDHRYLPFSGKLQAELSSPADLTIARLSELNVELAERYAEAAGQLDGLDDAQVCGCHGQTVYHAPASLRGERGHSLQIGSSAVLSARLNLPVVGDLRGADLALGGEGAPISPIAHWFFVPEGTRSWVVNLGGIANFTAVEDRLDAVQSQDAGPGMMLSNGWALRMSRGSRAFDEGGKLSAGGKVLPDVVDTILNHPFVSRSAPKSTGREEFGLAYQNEVFAKWSQHDPKDVAYSLLDVVPQLLHQALEQSETLFPPEQLLLTGGGAKNPELVKAFRRHFPHVLVTVQTSGLLQPSIHEPAAMAVIASRTWCGLPSSLPGVTGAQAAAILGHVHGSPLAHVPAGDTQRTSR